MVAIDEQSQISEHDAIDAFHSFLKNSLAQARAEKLLDDDTLSSAEADLMISGPALCLFFAALRATTNPPSVPLPRTSKSSPPLILSAATCPPAFKAFLTLWASTVPAIQSLSAAHQHDLARVICNHPPISNPPNPSVTRIAADLRGVAIEISQRRTFQERYSEDLQAALDTGRRMAGGSARDQVASPRGKKSQFVPPPFYEEKPSPMSSPSTSAHPSPSQPLAQLPPTGTSSARGNTLAVPGQAPSTPSLLTPADPSIEIIRETLYATLADVLASTPSLRPLVKSNPPRLYFASVGLAILEVSLKSLTPEGSVRGVLGNNVTFENCPVEYRPLLVELGKIGKKAQELAGEDDERAMRLAERGRDIPEPRMDRLRRMLEKGVGVEEASGSGNGRVSPDGTTLQFANQINALALGMTRLKAFRERQSEVFRVLASAR